MNKIIGIRYIGKKPEKTDSLLNTGARWKPGQVHNFAEPLARRLLAHTDSYEAAPVSVDGDTFMGGANKQRNEAPTIAYANLSGMGAEQLALFAMREFGRTIETDKRAIEDVRAEVHRLMVTTNMDAIADEAGRDLSEGTPYTIRVSDAELEALLSGQLVVKLIPAEVADDVPEAEAPADEAPAEEAKAEPTLDELLASLTTKDELLAFAVQEKVEGLTARNSVETMRSTISEAIKARMAGGTEPAAE